MLFDTSNALDDQKIAFEQNLKKLINLCAELKAQNSSLLSENELLKSKIVPTSSSNTAIISHLEPINDSMTKANQEALQNLIELALKEVNTCVQLLENQTINNHSV